MTINTKMTADIPPKLTVNEHRKREGGLRTKGILKACEPDRPLVSIFTVVYNGEKYLEKTIRSVLEQNYCNIEYIIIDGDSTDGTTDILKNFEDRIDYWVSEPDDGIYDAMNKGLFLCTGEIVGIINADDWYLPGAVHDSVNALVKSGKDYSIGAVRILPSGIIAKPHFPLEKGKVYQGMMYPHISAFIRREVYEAVGSFNTTYRIAADFDMALRIHLKGYEAVALDAVLAEVTEGGISGDVVSKREYRLIAMAHGKPATAAYADYFKQTLKYYIALLLPVKMKSFVRRFRQSRFQYER